MRNLFARFGIAFVMTILLALSFSYLAISIQNETIIDFDHTIISFVQSYETPSLTTFMTVMSWVGSATIVIPITLISLILLYFVWRRRAQALLFFIVIVGTVILNMTLKLYFHRERPDLNRIIEETGYSFPSGHTMMAFSLYIIIAFVTWRTVQTKVGAVMLTFFAAFMILAIAISRIYLGVHFPSDIIGGFLASGLWLALSIGVYQDIQRRNTQREDVLSNERLR